MVGWEDFSREASFGLCFYHAMIVGRECAIRLQVESGSRRREGRRVEEVSSALEMMQGVIPHRDIIV